MYTVNIVCREERIASQVGGAIGLIADAERQIDTLSKISGAKRIDGYLGARFPSFDIIVVDEFGNIIRSVEKWG